MKINKIESEKIFKYAYWLLILIFLLALAYTYFFLYKNVFLSIYFDASEYDANIGKAEDIDTARFNEVIRKIETRSVKKNLEINDIFN